MKATGKLERALRRLFERTAARCRGDTLVVGSEEGGLLAAIRERGLNVTHWNAGAARSHVGTLAQGQFKTIVVLDLLEYLDEQMGGEFLSHSWDLLAPGGRLIVIVPNAEGIHHPEHVTHFDPTLLERLLQPLGTPSLATDQPFRWLLMVLDKPRSGKRRLPRTRIDRYRVTARLCRGRVIELGCGEGHLTKMIHDRGLDAVGVDLSRRKIRQAREAYPEIPFIESDILGLELPDEEFDTAVLAEVLEHVPEDVGAEILQRAWRLVRPDGRLVVSVPNEDCIPHPNHVRQFDRRTLKELLRPFGKPRLVTDQPLQWLLMVVNKRG